MKLDPLRILKAPSCTAAARSWCASLLIDPLRILKDAAAGARREGAHLHTRRQAMSLKPDPIPAETARIAHAAFPHGNVFMQIRDELGPLYADDLFADLFPERGQPAASP
jgi:hypothetical protein